MKKVFIISFILAVFVFVVSCSPNYESLYAQKSAEVTALKQTIVVLNSELIVSKQVVADLSNQVSVLSQQNVSIAKQQEDLRNKLIEVSNKLDKLDEELWVDPYDHYEVPGFDYWKLSPLDKMKADQFHPSSCCGYYQR